MTHTSAAMVVATSLQDRCKALTQAGPKIELEAYTPTSCKFSLPLTLSNCFDKLTWEDGWWSKG